MRTLPFVLLGTNKIKNEYRVGINKIDREQEEMFCNTSSGPSYFELIYDDTGIKHYYW